MTADKPRYIMLVFLCLILFIHTPVLSYQMDNTYETIETDVDYFISSIRDGSLMLNVNGDVLIDVEPVKVSSYLICVSIGQCQALPNMQDLTRNLFGYISGLTEQQMAAYCAWAGKVVADENAANEAISNPDYGALFADNSQYFRCMVSPESTTTEYFRFPDITEVTAVFNSILTSVVYPKYTDIQEALDHGLSFVRTSDGMEEVYIPAGTFNMGYDGQDSKADEKNIHAVSLSSYLIDKFEVSNSQYALCVKQGACTAPASKASYKDVNYYGNPVYDNYPVIYINWDQAEKYCEWAGMRLPTEAEWEYAARGKEGYLYPWGNEYNSELVNDYSNGAYLIEASGSRPDDKSYSGVYDLGGNVSEWIWDFYLESQYNTAVLQKNPTGPTTGYYHVIRGGSILAAKTSTRSTNRASGSTTSNGPDRGFRCANTLDMIDFSKIKLSDELKTFVSIPSTTQLIGKGNLPADRIMAEGGEFSMGSSKGRIDEAPVHTILLSSFIVDKYEVTNEKYAACVAEDACTPPLKTNSLRIYDYYTNEAYGNFPVVNVTWEQAENYCEWVGGRLPTEAEWEFAAGGKNGLVYPWGDEFSATNLNYSGKGINDPEEIGTNEGDLSPLGALDMGGNVMEWVLDRYSAEYYKQSPFENPTGPDFGGYRVLRGSSYLQSDYYARVSCRYYALEGSSAQDRGFRCVYPTE